MMQRVLLPSSASALNLQALLLAHAEGDASHGAANGNGRPKREVARVAAGFASRRTYERAAAALHVLALLLTLAGEHRREPFIPLQLRLYTPHRSE